MSENIIIEMTQLIWKIIPDNQLCPSAEVIHDFSVLSLNYVAQGMLFVEREREREKRWVCWFSHAYHISLKVINYQQHSFPQESKIQNLNSKFRNFLLVLRLFVH